MGRDLCVGDRDSGVLARGRSGRVAERRVERDADLARRFGPLVLEVLCRRHDGHGLHDLGLEELGGDAQRERRLAGTGCCHRQEVAGVVAQVDVKRLLLPSA